MVEGAPLFPGERYPSLVRCGGAWLVTSRVSDFDKQRMRAYPSDSGGELVTLLRRLDTGLGTALGGRATPRLSSAHLMGIPAAVVRDTPARASNFWMQAWHRLSWHACFDSDGMRLQPSPFRSLSALMRIR